MRQKEKSCEYCESVPCVTSQPITTEQEMRQNLTLSNLFHPWRSRRDSRIHLSSSSCLGLPKHSALMGWWRLSLTRCEELLFMKRNRANVTFSNGKTTMKMLKVTLAQYGLHISGSRPELIERLKEFATNRDAWTECAQILSPYRQAPDNFAACTNPE